MGCSHTVGCPLFPLLRASLQGWRDHYCDSEDQWRECARYQMALTGERVPISLLPNGARARHLEDMAGTGRSGAAEPGQAPRQVPPDRPDAWSPDTGSWSQPAPTRPPGPSGPVIGTPRPVAWIGSAPPSAPVWPDRPSVPVHVLKTSDRPARHARQAAGSKRGWWNRFAEWMKGPA